MQNNEKQSYNEPMAMLNDEGKALHAAGMDTFQTTIRVIELLGYRKRMLEEYRSTRDEQILHAIKYINDDLKMLLYL